MSVINNLPDQESIYSGNIAYTAKEGELLCQADANPSIKKQEKLS
jgi:hypothetical protein